MKRAPLSIRSALTSSTFLHSSAAAQTPCLQLKPGNFLSSAAESFQNVGFIGLGNMGSHMASNLLKAGHSLCVLDRNEHVMQAFAAKGAYIAKTPLEVAERSDAVITMLPAAAHVQEVYTGSKGLLTNGGVLRSSLLIDCSTIDPQTCRLLSSKVAECKLAGASSSCRAGRPVMLDAPVSGGVGGAQAGTLTFMVGGPEDGLKAALPLFNAMGKSIVHCGGQGNGAAAKLCNNLVMGVSMAGVSEGYALGHLLGIDAVILSKIFNSSSARCWSSDTYNPVPGVMDGVPAARDYNGGFSCQLLVKDLGLALKAAEETGTSVPLTGQVHEMYSKLCKEGYGQKDFSGIFFYKYDRQQQPIVAAKESEDDPQISTTS